MASTAPEYSHVSDSRATARIAGWPSRALEASNPEWLISVGRLVTSLFALLAIYLDPTQPAHLFPESERVLVAYIIFAASLVVLPKRLPLGSPVHLLTHAVDLVVLGGLSLLTGELTSPFFAFFPFILLATTMRWGMAGAIIGALAIEALLVTVGWPDIEDGESELNILITRSAYFLVAAVMLGYFGASRDRGRERLARLANWPFDPIPTSERDWLYSAFAHAADVLGEPRLLAIWQDQENPVGGLAYWESGRLELLQIDDPDFWRRQNLETAQTSRSKGDQELDLLLAMVAAKRRNPVLAPQTVNSTFFAGINYRGRLFVLDPGCYYRECISLTEIIASRISHELERLALMREIADAARLQERSRLGRDLHDSILQDLTAASLKLKAAAAHVSDEAAIQLGSVGALLLDQQRRIRMFVEDARPSEHHQKIPLSGTLLECAEALRERWNCDVRLSVQSEEFDIPARVSSELSKLVAEATANAVRHGGATIVEVCAARRQDELELVISDNGGGIVADRTLSRTPLSIAERVRDLGGQLIITRFSPGLEILARVPLQRIG